MWAIIPSIKRVGHDVDPLSCLHWRPCLEDIPEDVRPFWTEQSRAFGQKILAVISSAMRTELLAPHEHGVKKEKFQASEACGVSIYWVMVQLYHPVDRKHRRSLEREIANFSKKFMKGDPMPPLKLLREKHQEAMDIACRLRWDTCATPLIEVLMSRDPLFTVRLEPWLELPDDPDDTVVELGELLSTIHTTTEHLESKHKVWDSHSAKSSQLQTLEAEVATLRAMVAQQGNHGRPKPGSVSDAANRDKPKIVPGKCWAKGCQQKVVGWTSTNNWKLCGTCLLKIKGDQKRLPLKDGTTFGKKAAIAQGIAFAAAKNKAKEKGKSTPYQQPPNPNSKRSKKRAAIAARAASLESEEGKGVALSSKRQKQTTPADEVMYYEG